MELKKYEKIIICITVILGIFCLGFYIGRDTGRNDVIVMTYGSGGPSTDSVVTHNSITAPTDKNTGDTEHKLNINTATAEDLQLLPGIGSVIAERIIQYRTENGNFETVEDLLNVSGIGTSKLQSLEDYITT